ncbi:MAG: DUF72 domain-containing protein [Candidatus Aenigmarchaeota archaeon]|nr:DUF72 domain-containing protein [Candidatus Aenigmarchaeota archaeon]
MEVFVGTSGWFYDWNPDLSFDWYVKNSGLNAIELNASFYRFPFPNQVKAWVKKTEEIKPELKWAIKVNKAITHTFKFNQRAFELWERFAGLFKPLEEKIEFYLFQLPPSFTPKFSSRLEKFIRKTGLEERFALEVRNLEWFKEEWVEWAKKLKITWVSVDSPDFPLEVYSSNKIVYQRMHGRTAWYSHYYTDKELKEVKEKILDLKPKKVFVAFNNNHAMLENAQRMLELLIQGKITRKENGKLKLKSKLYSFLKKKI